MKSESCTLVATAFLCSSLLVATVDAQAMSVTMQFTVTGFDISNENSAPTNPVTGSISWEAASVNGPIQSFTSINLNLDGHAYSIGEIGYYSFPSDPYTSWDVIGGTLNDVGGIGNQTDDFWIRWDRDQLTWYDFSYSSSQKSGIWYSGPGNTPTFTPFSIAASPVPLPAAAWLLGSGLLGLIGVARKRKAA